METRIDTKQLKRPRLQKMVLGLFLLSFLAVIAVKAWMSDDAYITVRTVDNALHGHGLRWNIDERVQAYTHPLWLLAILALTCFTREYFVTTIALGLVVSVAAVIVLCTKIARTWHGACLAVVVLTLSRAFGDFSTSGLENPLSHLLLALFLASFLQNSAPAQNARRLFVLAGLAACNRLDTVLLYVPALLHAIWKQPGRATLRAAALGAVPILAWESFSLFYYGAPFPNTAYAKLNTGLGGLELARHGLWYFANSWRSDPLTLAGVAVGAVTPIIQRRGREAVVGLGILAYLLYIVAIGGDFMSGRYFTVCLFAGMALLTRLQWRPWLSWAAVVALPVLVSLSPFRPWPRLHPQWMTVREHLRDTIDAHGIADERRHYEFESSLRVMHHRSPWPAPERAASAASAAASWYADGFVDILKRTGIFPEQDAWPPEVWEMVQSQSGRPVVVRGAVGMFAFYLGPRVHLLDYYGLGDPLLARLRPLPTDPLLAEFMPHLADQPWRVGHFIRRIPAGYYASLVADRNYIEDPGLARDYDTIRLVTRGRLTDPRRLRAIWDLNTHRDRSPAASRPEGS